MINSEYRSNMIVKSLYSELIRSRNFVPLIHYKQNILSCLDCVWTSVRRTERSRQKGRMQRRKRVKVEMKRGEERKTFICLISLHSLSHLICEICLHINSFSLKVSVNNVLFEFPNCDPVTFVFHHLPIILLRFS